MTTDRKRKPLARRPQQVGDCHQAADLGLQAVAAHVAAELSGSNAVARTWGLACLPGCRCGWGGCATEAGTIAARSIGTGYVGVGGVATMTGLFGVKFRSTRRDQSAIRIGNISTCAQTGCENSAVDYGAGVRRPVGASDYRVAHLLPGFSDTVIAIFHIFILGRVGP
jgi:hypothetical protein